MFKDEGCHDIRRGVTMPSIPVSAVSKAKTEIFMAIECKTPTNDWCNVPAVQLQRCRDWVNSWELYTDKVVMLAFK